MRHEVCLTWQSEVDTNGSVTTDTKLAVEETKRQKEENRWREMYPEIKECHIVITRQRLDQLEELMVNLRRDEERREETPNSDWLAPLEETDRSSSCDDGNFRRFVKKLEVKVCGNHGPANGPKRTRRKRRQLFIRERRRVAADSARSCQPDAPSSPHSKKRKYRCNKIYDIASLIKDHNYSLVTELPVTRDGEYDTPSSQRKDDR